MKYDFTTPIDRTGVHAIAVDMIPIKGAEVKEGFSKIPMWVADMNFRTAPAIQEEIIRRVQHPTFGYSSIPDEYYDRILNFQKTRKGQKDITKECIGYENGVLGGVVSALGAFCSKGDPVLLHYPTYIGFTGVLENNGYKIVHSPLVLDENGVWRMDFEDMDRKIKENKIHAAVFCAPHNPCGRVWERWELEKAWEVYKNNDVYVACDEIWSDIVLNGNVHIPPQTISEDAKMRTVAFYAPTKTYNLASLQGSYHVIYNPYLRDRIAREASLSHYNNANLLSVYAQIGAYSEAGIEWVDQLCEALTQNVNDACDFIKANFRGVALSKPEGTYMLFLDCEAWCKEHGKTLDELLRAGIEVGVIWQDGRPFGGDYTIRMNLALPNAIVREAFERLRKYVFCV